MQRRPGNRGTRAANQTAGRRGPEGEGVTLHELLKREAYEGGPASVGHFARDRPAPRATLGAGFRYLTLDSFGKNKLSNIARGEFSWNLMVEGSADEDHAGSRYVLGTVIGMDIDEFFFPNVSEVPYVLVDAPPVSPSGLNRLILKQNNLSAVGQPPTMIINTPPPWGQYPYQLLNGIAFTATSYFRIPWINNPYSQIPNGNKVTVQVREAGNQGICDANGQRHHFEFTSGYYALVGATNPNFAQVVPTPGCTTYNFTDPIKSLEKITLVFRNPDIPIAFLPDVYYDVTVDLASGGPPVIALQFSVVDHQLNQGDRIYVTGCACGHAPLDAYVNRPQGHVASANPADLVAGIPFPQEPIPTPDTFVTDPMIGVQAITAPLAFPQRVNVYVLRRRLWVSLCVRTVEDRLTQYMYPS
jgi:hypothetical protein